MLTFLRSVGAILTGMIVAMILLIAVELFSSVVHPLPADFDNTQEAMCKHVERYPAWVLAVVVPLWAVTAFLATWIAGKLANRASALIVGALLVAAVALNVAMLPYPMWFKVVDLIAIPLAVAAGVYFSRRRSVAELNAAV
jgi:hypothetical protein